MEASGNGFAVTDIVSHDSAANRINPVYLVMDLEPAVMLPHWLSMLPARFPVNSCLFGSPIEMESTIKDVALFRYHD